MSDESDDISCPTHCSVKDTVKAETPLPPPSKPSKTARKSKATSEKVSASKADNKPKKRAVTKPSSRGRGKRPQPPVKRVQPQRKKVAKGLQFEDDLSSVQETNGPHMNFSSSDEDIPGQRLFRSRRKVLQKKSNPIETESDKEDGHCDEVDGSSNHQDDTDDKLLPTLPANVTGEAPAGTHHLIDELFGGGPERPETATSTGDAKSRQQVSDPEGSDTDLLQVAKITTPNKKPGGTADSGSAFGREYGGSSMHGQDAKGESSKDSAAVDLDAELFGF